MPSALLARDPLPDPDLALASADGSEPFANRMKTCSVVVYSESTLYRLPWSGLHRGGERGSRRTAAPARSAASRRPPRPGTFERALFRALEWIAVDHSVAQGLPFANPLILHPRDICERLCWRATQPQFRAIEAGLQTLCRVRIPADARGGSKTFGVLQSAAPKTPRGTGQNAICPDSIIHFDARFVESINAGNIVPLNWGLWVALHDPLAQRLMEVLEAEWPDPAQRMTATFTTDFLSERIPFSPALGRARRKELLDQAHEDLIRQGYLRQTESLSLNRTRYRPGTTFLAMRYCLKDHHERVVLNGVRSGAESIRAAAGFAEAVRP
jgi:hypothetical protein